MRRVVTVRVLVCLLVALWCFAGPVSAQPPIEAMRTEVVRRAKPREAMRRTDEPILVGPDALRRRLMAQLEQGVRDTPLHFLQIGDSHSANGYFAMELAASVAGAVRVAPSFTVPFTRGLGLVRQTFSPEWRRSTWLQPIDGGVTGPGGTSALTRSPQAVARFVLPAGLPASRLTIWWTAPIGTRFRLRFDAEAPLLLATGVLARGSVMSQATIAVPAGVRQMVLDEIHVPGEGELRLHGFSLDHPEARITYDVLAVGGATQTQARTRTGGTLGFLLAERKPDVVLIWFGTNSVIGLSSPYERFTRDYAALLDTVQQHLPEAMVILMGPPDLGRMPSGCRVPGRTCPPVSHPNVAVIRDLIRGVAMERGLLFFDVYRLYGERGGMLRGYQNTPPLVRPDLVHFTEAGYQDVARRLRAALVQSEMRGR